MTNDISIEINPKMVLIKITREEHEAMFSVWVDDGNGRKIQLFTDVEEEAGYERKFRQNLSVGTIVAAGGLVKGILAGDLAIIDYLVTGTTDYLVGTHKGSMLIAIHAYTTYHKSNSTPYIDGRLNYKKGEYKDVSLLLGVVRNKQLHARDPWIFLKHQLPEKMEVTQAGLLVKTTEGFCVREVLAAPPESGYKTGDKVLINEGLTFTRVIDNKVVSVIDKLDIVGVV